MRVRNFSILAAAALAICAPAAQAQVEAISFPTEEPVRVWRYSIPEVPVTGRVFS